MYTHTVMKQIIFLITGSLAIFDCSSVEEATYRVVEKDEKFEIRQYEKQIQAQTTVEGYFKEVGNEGFRRLASYIFAKKRDGKNKIAMTAPVSQNLKTEGPQTTMVSEQKGSYTIGFVMPAEYSLANLPKPKDDRVKLIEKPRRKMAVISYSGTWSKNNYKEHEGKLMAKVSQLNLKIKGNPEWARYNAPFTPWFMRRNEVMVEIE